MAGVSGAAGGCDGAGGGGSGARGAFYPGRAPIDAYGNGGFRFAGMSHRGSILCLPSGIAGWNVIRAEDIDLAALAPVIAEAAGISVLLVGTGGAQVFIPLPVRLAIEAMGMSIEPMSTGSAARTYNVLLAEERAVAAALLAVE